MPRRYQKALNLAKFSAQVKIKTSDNESDTEDDFPPDQEAEDNNEPDYLRSILENAPHFSNPGMNTGMLGQILYDQDENQKQDLPNCSVTVPLPLFLARDGQTPREEACIQRPGAYDEWTRNLQLHKAIFDRRFKNMRQREKKQEQGVHSASLFEMAEHIARQENSFFRDSYDYYYTGGNLNTMPFEGGHLAMHVSGNKLRDLHFSRDYGEAEFWQQLHSTHLEEASSEVFELQPLDNLNRSHMFLARFLNEVSLYQLKRKEEQDPEDYELIRQCMFSSQEAPLTSVAQSMANANNLALASQDRSLRFVDIPTQKDIAKLDVCLLKGLKQTTSTWAQLMPADGSTFHYLTQPVLLTVDVRCNQPLNPCFASSVHSKACERFSSLARSVNPNLLYVASNHKLHCLDIRCLGKKLTDRAVVTWTHQMTFPPSFIDTCAHENSEYIALAGLLPKDLRICELQKAQAKTVDEMFSPAIPFAPLTLEEALIDARLGGFTNVYADLAERVTSCMTGMRFHRLEEASDHAFAQLLTSNSLGDVYCQRLTLRDDEEHVHDIRTGLHTTEAIRYLANAVNERVQRESLRCTEVQSIPEIRDIFRDATKRSKPDEKPLIVEEIEIDYAIKDTDVSEDESLGSEKAQAETSKSKKKDKKTTKKKTKEKPKRQPKKKAPCDRNVRKKKSINRGSWQKSAYQLSHYTDMMSIRLLDVWDMEEYDTTRDVTKEMFEERFKDKQLEPEQRMANWLDQLPSQAGQPTEDEVTEANPDMVPGTSLPKLYGATTANYTVIAAPDPDKDIEQPHISPKRESPNAFSREFSILLPGQNTIIEDYATPPPAKRPKVKHIMGF
ncbi:uncharacterized protein LOC6547976 [Drosophila erecta]|uniref:Uncharacterized protein n=1 Tax=Drosophila erecta TaxID=7220 RepID=B3NMW5_DROER|nr:uncharacterized protein LOC6547976 [Drosophila erecta]XP_026836647.1 uncharacterized protein LOC6547976 [Drosophila erecta]EDV55459.1 uncharacterized protein Dere_GG20774 [Drosophila erecta]